MMKDCTCCNVLAGMIKRQHLYHLTLKLRSSYFSHKLQELSYLKSYQLLVW